MNLQGEDGEPGYPGPQGPPGAKVQMSFCMMTIFHVSVLSRIDLECFVVYCNRVSQVWEKKEREAWMDFQD